LPGVKRMVVEMQLHLKVRFLPPRSSLRSSMLVPGAARHNPGAQQCALQLHRSTEFTVSIEHQCIIVQLRSWQ
jgi:hypothetical protein